MPTRELIKSMKETTMPVRTDGIVEFGFNPEARIKGENTPGMAHGTN